MRVPGSPAACAIDVDGMDYWYLLAILQIRQPSLLVCEYNCHVAIECSEFIVQSQPSIQRDNNYGASLLALSQLARTRGYRLVHIHGPLNLYFIREEAKVWQSIEVGLTSII